MGEEAQIPCRPLRRRDTSADAGAASPSRAKRRRASKADVRCGSCALLFSPQGLERLDSCAGFRHKTRAACMASRADGCRMCEYIALLVSREHGEQWGDDEGLLFRNIQSPRSTDGPGIYGLAGNLASEPEKRIITMCAFAEQGNPIEALVPRRPLARDVQSESVFRAARARIKECMDPREPHRLCQYSRDTVLPTRVLDVGKPGDAHATIKLKVNDTETHAPYLALSYCWGPQPKPTAPVQLLLLRKNTLQDLADGIRPESLQKSIRDAVVVTRRLGFRYLWVDALCIIQDCPADKDEEISRMASIYKNAAITIAASSSRRAIDGFLGERVPPYIPDRAFDIPMADGARGAVHLSAEAYEPEHPLDKRGWTLQEFMLSSRMLIFSDYELLWQCKEVDLRGVTGAGLEYMHPFEALPWTVFDDDAEPFFGNADFDKLYLWKTIIQQYTERELTDPADRLRAVMGITTELEMLWRDTNVYGLWKKWFIELLAWYKPDVDREERRCLARAPSWSWAYLDRVIHHEGPLTTADAKVKTLTMSSAELTCRILQEGDVACDKVGTISERPDLMDPGVELRKGATRDLYTDYLLLGTVKAQDDVDKGIGLIVVDVGKKIYRRIGLVIFTDMSIWKGAMPRDITLEPKFKR